jgi:hypothetical protein
MFANPRRHALAVLRSYAPVCQLRSFKSKISLTLTLRNFQKRPRCAKVACSLMIISQHVGRSRHVYKMLQSPPSESLPSSDHQQSRVYQHPKQSNNPQPNTSHPSTQTHAYDIALPRSHLQPTHHRPPSQNDFHIRLLQ